MQDNETELTVALSHLNATLQQFQDHQGPFTDKAFRERFIEDNRTALAELLTVATAALADARLQPFTEV